MSPVSSATEMKSPGLTMPRTGCSQRTSASKPTTSPPSSVDRLIVQRELVLVHGAAQLGLQPQAVDEPAVRTLVGELAAAAPPLLAAVERGVGVAQHALGRRRGVGGHGDADGGCQVQLSIIDPERIREGIVHLLGEPERLALAPHVLAGHGEQVASDATERVGGAQSGTQPQGDGAQQVVAGMMAQRFVDDLNRSSPIVRTAEGRSRLVRLSDCPSRSRNRLRLGSSVSGSCSARRRISASAR